MPKNTEQTTKARSELLPQIYQDFRDKFGDYLVGDLEKVKKFYPTHPQATYDVLGVSNPEELQAVLNMQGAAESEVGYLDNEGYRGLYESYLEGNEELSESDKELYKTLMEKIQDQIGGCFCVCGGCKREVPSYLAEYVEDAINPNEMEDMCNHCAEYVHRFYQISDEDDYQMLIDVIESQLQVDEEVAEAITQEFTDQLEEEEGEQVFGDDLQDPFEQLLESGEFPNGKSVKKFVKKLAKFE